MHKQQYIRNLCGTFYTSFDYLRRFFHVMLTYDAVSTFLLMLFFIRSMFNCIFNSMCKSLENYKSFIKLVFQYFMNSLERKINISGKFISSTGKQKILLMYKILLTVYGQLKSLTVFGNL